MRFKPIKTYHPELDRPDCIRNLVSDLGVTSWTRVPLSLQEAIRGMRAGRAYPRRDDRERGVGRGFNRRVIDHAVMLTSEHGVFMLTMPYNTEDGFYRDFSDLMREQAKYGGGGGCYVGDICAQIVSNRYKTRENRDFAAFIATVGTMEALRGLMRSQ